MYLNMETKRISHHSTNASVLNSILKQKKSFVLHCLTMHANLFCRFYPLLPFSFKLNNLTIICCIIVINLPDSFVFAIYFGRNFSIDIYTQSGKNRETTKRAFSRNFSLFSHMHLTWCPTRKSLQTFSIPNLDPYQ